MRPGAVFRLYSKDLFEKFRDHEESEIHRKPLQDVILGLHIMMEDSMNFEGVVPILEDMLEPPEMVNVEQSFEYLHKVRLLTGPTDQDELTAVGRMAALLPIDIELGRVVAYGVNLSVGPEAVVMASALSQPKTCFRIASSLIHTDPDEMHSILQTTLMGAIQLDRGMYSEPMM